MCRVCVRESERERRREGERHLWMNVWFLCERTGEIYVRWRGRERGQLCVWSVTNRDAFGQTKRERCMCSCAYVKCVYTKDAYSICLRYVCGECVSVCERRRERVSVVALCYFLSTGKCSLLLLDSGWRWYFVSSTTRTSRTPIAAMLCYAILAPLTPPYMTAIL